VSAVREVPARTKPRPRPDWLDWLLSLGYVALVLPAILGAAVLQGFLIGESEPEKYRLFAPDWEKRG
jgi:hypothetical protein